MKKLIISALCLIWCFAVCIQPVYADDNVNFDNDAVHQVDRFDNPINDNSSDIHKVDIFGDSIDGEQNGSKPDYAKK